MRSLTTLASLVLLCAPVLGFQTTWQQSTYFKALNAEAGDEFGAAVALSQNFLVIGAPGEASNSKGVNGNPLINGAADSGAVYVFRKLGAGWKLEGYLKGSNSQAGDRFGSSVAVFGDTIAVGAPLEDSGSTGINQVQNDETAPHAGAVYLFRRVGGSWTQTHYIKAPNTDAGDQFGHALALTSNRLLVGAPYEASLATAVNGDLTDNSAPAAGAVFAYERLGSNWVFDAYLKAKNTEANEQFGIAVALSENMAFVGADLEDGGSAGINGDGTDNSQPASGAVYSFVRGAGNWSQSEYIKASNPAGGANFGHAIAATDNRLYIGAPGESSASKGVDGNQTTGLLPEAGAAYVFERSGSASFVQSAYIKASNTNADDRFGVHIAAHGERVLITAVGEDSASGGINGDQFNELSPTSGAVYLFARESSTWRQYNYIKAAHPQAFGRFGLDAAINGDVIAIGSHGEASSSQGLNSAQVAPPADETGAVFGFTPTPTGCGTTEYFPSTGKSDIQLGATILPVGDMHFTLEIGGNPTAPLSSLAISTGTTEWSYLGGTVLVDLALTIPTPGYLYHVPIVNGFGEATFKMPIGIVGMTFYAQAAQAILGPLPKVVWSNGLAVTVCP